MHADIWGPGQKPTVNGEEYFLTIVDNYSRYTWIFIIKDKGSTRMELQHFYAYVETQFETNIKIIRSDNGLEFSVLFYAFKGIFHQTSCTYTSQQNGVAERKHQYILNIGRALKFQSSLPLGY